MNDPKRILIVRLSHLGDVACTLGLLHALHAAYPRAEIAWAIQPEFEELVAPLPGLGRTIAFDRRGGWRAWLKIRRELRAFGADLVVDAQGNLKSAAITWLSGAPRRVGMARVHWREKLGHRVLTDSAPALAEGEHAHLVARLDGLIAHLLGELDPELERSALASAAELDRGRQVLRRGFEADKLPLLVSLCVPGDVRSWPEEHWIQLLDGLARRGQAVLITYGPLELESARRLREQRPELGGLRQWAEPMDLRGLVGLLQAAADKGARFLGVDSGPMHLAWSSGMGVIVLEGPHDALRTGPWPLGSERHRELRAAASPSCAPCLKRRCTHAEGNVCMQDLLPEQVLQELP